MLNIDCFVVQLVQIGYIEVFSCRKNRGSQHQQAWHATSSLKEDEKMELGKKRFKKMFPKLTEEMETDESHFRISSVRSEVGVAERASAKRFDNYIPDAVDYIRRCDNEKQAEEIIDYLERRNEITKEYAHKLRKQLKTGGVRSFGPKKQDDYYSRAE